MRSMIKHSLIGLSIFFVIIFSCLLFFRLSGAGIIVIPSEEIDPSGIGMVYQREWKIVNLWFSPLKVDAIKKTCSCLKEKIDRHLISFLHSGKIILTVSAANKYNDFEEKAILKMSRDTSKLEKLLTIHGKPFLGFDVYPDAIKLPFQPQKPYSKIIKIKMPKDIPFKDVALKATDKEIQFAWVAPPRSIDDVYSEILLNIKGLTNRENYKEYIIISIKGIKVKKLKVFC